MTAGKIELGQGSNGTREISQRSFRILFMYIYEFGNQITQHTYMFMCVFGFKGLRVFIFVWFWKV